MYQIDVDTAANSRPAATSQGAAKWFTDGTVGVTPATIVPAEFLNMMMAEMMNVLVAGGVTADKAESDQLAIAIQNMIDATRIPTGFSGFHTGATAPSGWVVENGGTIGSASSGATTRANADTSALYAHLWDTYNNSTLVIQSSSGTPTTRGVSAAADFAANKRMPLFDVRGEFIRGWDDGRGVDTGRALGSYQTDQNKQHTHTTDWTTYNEDGSTANHMGSGGASPDDIFQLSTKESGGAEARPRNLSRLSIIKL